MTSGMCQVQKHREPNSLRLRPLVDRVERSNQLCNATGNTRDVCTTFSTLGLWIEELVIMPCTQPITRGANCSGTGAHFFTIYLGQIKHSITYCSPNNYKILNLYAPVSFSSVLFLALETMACYIYICAPGSKILYNYILWKQSKIKQVR